MEIVLGRVLGAHGVRGWVRVRYEGDGPAHLVQAERIKLASDERGTAARTYEIEGGGTGRAGEARLKLAGVGNRDAANALKGSWVLGQTAELEALPDGEFYWYQLVGCVVTTEDGTPVGTVREIWETGAHDVLVVKREDGRQVLIPTARELLTQIDLEEKKLVVAPLPGLLEPV